MSLKKKKRKAEKKMYKVLIFGMTENPGGVESVIMNYVRNFNKKLIQCDFLSNTMSKIAYEDELLRNGCKVFHFPPRKNNPLKFRKNMDDFFRVHSSNYNCIWVNVCSLANIDYIKYAKKYGISKRIIHSHNSQNMDTKIRLCLHKINKKKIAEYATDFWACSKGSACWFYEKDIEKKCTIINNAIDLDKYSFDSSKRNKLREEMGIESEYVIGNIGRLHFQKNQTFAIDVFACLKKLIPDSTLILVGQGEDEKQLKEKAKSLGIKDSVLFVGIQKDIQMWLSAFDCFLFPSLFEGLSVSALEAQANGVPTIASNGVIPEEIKMNSNFVFFNLNNTDKKWAEKIIEIKNNLARISTEEIISNFKRKGFEIKSEAEKVEKLLIGE